MHTGSRSDSGIACQFTPMNLTKDDTDSSSVICVDETGTGTGAGRTIEEDAFSSTSKQRFLSSILALVVAILSSAIRDQIIIRIVIAH